MPTEQNYKNHTRWYPLVHFVLMPILAINLIWQIVMLIVTPTWDRGEMLLLAVSLIILALAARLQALRVQDRLIRLEERLRIQALLDTEIVKAAQALSPSQLIALRFADDSELSDLVRRTLNGEIKTQKEIKSGISKWRADHLRV
ncbi:MAG: DUF6526 family protein [Acidobacteriota bacterium]